MAKRHSNKSKLTVEYRGGKIAFGLHKPTGQYRKKYRGKTLYLGSDPAGVLDQWLAKTELVEADLAEKPVKAASGPMTVRQLCNRFLADKEADVASGELTQVTFDEYLRYAKRIVAFFGSDQEVVLLTPSDFTRFKADLAKAKPQRREGKIVKKATKRTLSLNGLATKIRHVRVFFNHAHGEGWIDQLPWGAKSFSLKAKAVKKNAGTTLPKQATRDEITALIDAADDTWKALILFAINTGSGNTDSAMLKHDEIDADGWVEKARNKTGEYRRFRLWPETLEAIAKLPKNKDGYVFHSKQGSTLVPVGKHNPITKGFTKLATAAKVKRQNLSFYSMRHTFQTQADEGLDFVATQVVMGHSRSTMSDNYRGRISDDRLAAVCEQVREWLFAGE